MCLSVLPCIELLDVLAGGLTQALRQSKIRFFLRCDPRYMATDGVLVRAIKDLLL